jgi:DNA-binding GntR family transcriptional regulator
MTEPAFSDISPFEESPVMVDRVSTAAQVAKGLREMIISGKLPPGTRLREEQLAASIGVARNTIREALRLLGQEGVVKHNMHRSFVVTDLTEADVVDIFRVRRTLELGGIDASANATRAQMDALRETLDGFKRAAESGDDKLIVDTDVLFHERLVAFLQSPRIDRFYSTFRSELRLCLSIVDHAAHDAGELVAEHQELIDSLDAGERERCKELLLSHLDDGERLLKEVIRANAQHD